MAIVSRTLTILAFAISLATVVVEGSPTHIIKFKDKMNATDAHTYLLSAHKAHLMSRHPTMFEWSNPTALQAHEDLLSLETIYNNDGFVAMSGNFARDSFLTELDLQEEVDYVEPNQIYRATYVVPPTREKRDLRMASTPNWGLARIHHRDPGQYDSYNYNENSGDGIHVYVLDTGVFAEHTDFEGRAKMEVNFIPEEENTDMGGHGTHVAAKVAGKTYGVAKKATIHAIKILDKDGAGSTTDLIRGISHVLATAVPGKSIINLSLSGPKSRLVDDIISKGVLENRIPVFVSAGNSGNNACFFSPSSNPHAFAVGATDINDQVPYYSDFGECVRIYAPGSNIKSAWIGSPNESKDMFGTSMANPHVVGIAAALMSQQEFASVDQLYEAVSAMATKDKLTFHASGVAQDNHSKNLLAYNDVVK